MEQATDYFQNAFAQGGRSSWVTGVATQDSRRVSVSSARGYHAKTRIAIHGRLKSALGLFFAACRARSPWQQRGGEVDAGKIRASQIRLPQDGYAHIGAGKFRAVHICQTQIHVAQMGALEIHIRKVAAEEFHAAGLRFGQIGSGKNRFRHVRVAEVGFAQVCAGEIGARKFCLAQVGAFEVGVAQDCAAQICPAQVRVRKVRAGQVGSNSAVFAAEKTLVGFENIRERLSIVLDVFRFLNPMFRPPSMIRTYSLLDVAVRAELRAFSSWTEPGSGRRGVACARSELTTACVTSLPPHELL